METVAYVLGLMATGLIVGALARLGLPGRDPMSIFETMLVGIAGTLIAGLITYYLFTVRPRPACSSRSCARSGSCSQCGSYASGSSAATVDPRAPSRPSGVAAGRKYAGAVLPGLPHQLPRHLAVSDARAESADPGVLSLRAVYRFRSIDALEPRSSPSEARSGGDRIAVASHHPWYMGKELEAFCFAHWRVDPTNSGLWSSAAAAAACKFRGGRRMGRDLMGHAHTVHRTPAFHESE